MTRRIAAAIALVLLTWLPASAGADTCAGATCPGRPAEVAGHAGRTVDNGALNGTGGGRLLVFCSVAVGLATFGLALTVIATRRRARSTPRRSGTSEGVAVPPQSVPTRQASAQAQAADPVARTSSPR